MPSTSALITLPSAAKERLICKQVRATAVVGALHRKGHPVAMHD